MSPEAKDRDKAYVSLGLRITGEFGAIIAVPAVLLTILGKWLDGRGGTAPRYIILGFVLATLISGVSIYKKAKEFSKKYQDIEKKNP